MTRTGSDLALIALAVIAFNLIAVVGLNVLLHDDPGWYKMVLDGSFPRAMTRSMVLAPFKEWLAWKVMAYSPNLARGLYVLLLMVPLSFGFYHLLRNALGLPRTVAVAAAVAPNVLPAQWQIPAGINMSYHLWGLLAALLSLILGLSYLGRESPRDGARLIGAGALFAAASQLMEQTLFLCPSFLVAVWGYRENGAKRRRLLLTIAILSGLRLVQMVLFPRKPALVVPGRDLPGRIVEWVKSSLPSPPGLAPVYPALCFALVVGAGALILLKRSGRRTAVCLGPAPRGSHGAAYLLAFLGTWSVFTIIVFLFLTEWFPPRYSHISSFGMNALLFLSLHAILAGDRSGNKRWVGVLFAGLILYSGVARFFNLRAIFGDLNRNRVLIEETLAPLVLPPNSQVVLSGLSRIPGGWLRASGYLMFTLKRRDVSGLIGIPGIGAFYNFDDHFNPKERGWRVRYSFTGLDLRRPVFLFARKEGVDGFAQLEYALQWRGTALSAPWTIHRFDKSSGRGEPVLSGSGWDEYLRALKTMDGQGIRQADILWGGPPTPEEWRRLSGGGASRGRE